MNTRRIILIAICVLLVFGIGNFIVNSVQTRSQLSLVASTNTASQDEGVQRLMDRGILFDALQGGAPRQTRLNAIDALARLARDGKHKDAFEQLLQMLKDPDTESVELKTHPVRDAATAAVAKVGVAYPDILMDAAKDQDGSIKAQSIAALKTIGKPFEQNLASRLGDSALRAPFGDILATFGPEAIPLIAPYLQPPLLKLDAKPDDLSKAKIDLINTLGEFTAPEAATPLLPYANDPDPNVRRAVVASLASIGQPVGAPVLIAALNDPNSDPSARAAAAAALGAIATPEANAAMEKALTDYDLSVAAAAASGLKRAGDPAAAAIAEALASPDPAVRARAASATGGQHTTALAAKALADPDPGVRANGAEAMGDVLFRASTVSSDLARLAAAADPKAQAAAYEAVVKHGVLPDLMGPGGTAAARANAIDVLNAQVTAAKTDAKKKPMLDTIAKIQAAPAGGAATAASPPVTSASVAPLIAALGDSDGTVAQAATRALGSLGELAIDPLVASLGNPNETVAYYASQALTTIGRPAVDAILAVAQPGKPAARWAAITLGQIGDSRAAGALETLARSPDADTAYAAGTALARVKPS